MNRLQIEKPINVSSEPGNKGSDAGAIVIEYFHMYFSGKVYICLAIIKFAVAAPGGPPPYYPC